MNIGNENNMNNNSSKMIIYIHGMGATPSYFDTIRSYKNLKKYHHFVPLHREYHTLKSIDIQTDILITELLEYLITTKKNNFDILFVGHSQGGLVAANILKNINDTRLDHLNINVKGIFTIGTPWNGVPIAGLANQHGLIPEDHLGTKDLIPNSSFLESLKCFLEHEDLTINFPDLKILPVAGKLGSSSKRLLGLQLSIIKPFLKIYNMFSSRPIFNNKVLDHLFSYLKNEDHDSIVSIKSQHGKGTIPNNLLLLPQDVLIDNLKHDKVENMIPKPSRIFKGKAADMVRNMIINTLKNEHPQLESKTVIKLLTKFAGSIF